MTLGFVVGKFYPPHRGHKYLIDTTRTLCDRLIVMIAHHPSQAIPGELRKSWLEEIHPDCEIHLVNDVLDNDSAQWADFTVRYLGRSPDIVFSSEQYGPGYARLMGARHIMVDLGRTTIAISGTAVRSEPLRYLHYLEPCVRAHFVRRVVILGAESTGKTTLARILANEFDTTWVPEYGREQWEQKVRDWGEQEGLPGWSEEDFIHIARQQQLNENRLARLANRVLICDTNAFATGTWYERYFHCRNLTVDSIGAADKVDMYLLTAPDVPFVQDGFRDGELIRDWMHDRFSEQLASATTSWLLIDGPYPERIDRAVAAVETLLGY